MHEYPAPGGGTWQPLLADLGYREVGDRRDGSADVVVDDLALMHEADQCAALAARAGHFVKRRAVAALPVAGRGHPGRTAECVAARSL